jgi:hypothetical protein
MDSRHRPTRKRRAVTCLDGPCLSACIAVCNLARSLKHGTEGGVRLAGTFTYITASAAPIISTRLVYSVPITDYTHPSSSVAFFPLRWAERMTVCLD